MNWKIILVVGAILLSGTLLAKPPGGLPSSAAGKSADKATGDVIVINVETPARRHWFSFVAHEGVIGLTGKGFLAHQRLSPDGMEVWREEYCLITYAIVDGKDASFAGPIVYDSDSSDPTRWFVVQVYDGGKPSDDNDWLWFERVADETEALDKLNTLGKPHDVISGNLKVH